MVFILVGGALSICCVSCSAFCVVRLFVFVLYVCCFVRFVLVCLCCVCL